MSALLGSGSLGLLAEEIHVAFSNWWTCIDGYLGVIVVNPIVWLVLLPSMANVMSGVDTGTQVCNETLHFEYPVCLGSLIGLREGVCLISF